MRNFKDLDVWSRSHKMTLEIYKITLEFPKEELYGLVNQMRRSSQSIPTNIAEGCGRNSEKELLRYCNIAMGSASELEYQLLLAFDLSYLKQDEYTSLFEELITIKRKLNKFIQFLQKEIQNLKSLTPQYPKNLNTQ